MRAPALKQVVFQRMRQIQIEEVQTAQSNHLKNEEFWKNINSCKSCMMIWNHIEIINYLLKRKNNNFCNDQFCFEADFHCIIFIIM